MTAGVSLLAASEASTIDFQNCTFTNNSIEDPDLLSEVCCEYDGLWCFSLLFYWT